MRVLVTAFVMALPGAALMMVLPEAAQAETHTLSIRNGGSEAVVGVYMALPGSGSMGANRLRSQLPPGIEGPFTFSTGCRADVRLAYASGRSEDHRDVDMCAGARVVAGQDGVVGPAVAAVGAAPKGENIKGTKVVEGVATPVKAPPPVVPPWTGKSITKRFGGMD